MFGEATPDVSGTFAGEAIRLPIQIAALQTRPRRVEQRAYLKFCVLTLCNQW
jgi:hypothetical protein